MMYKFLDPIGVTYQSDGRVMYYNLPGCETLQRLDEFAWPMWGNTALTRHPDPAEPDGDDCGAGRIHLMHRLDARYAPRRWWPWWACNGGRIIGESTEKVAVSGVWLRRISRQELWWRLRRGEGRKADLRWADLCWANLRGADLYEAVLRWAVGLEKDIE
jgi:hypothetical protein